MRYNIQGSELTITPEIRTYVEKQLVHVEKFTRHPDVARADIELAYRPDGVGYRAEITLHNPGGEAARAEALGTGLHEVIDIAVSELSRELSQTKRKHLQTLRRGAARAKDYLRGFRARL